MRRTLNCVVSAAFVLAAWTASAQAQTVPLFEHCEGTVQSFNPLTGVLTFAGKGRATVFGLYAVEGSSTAIPLSLTDGLVSGGDTSTTRDGATIKSEFEGVYEVLESGKIKFRVTARWGEGTGRLTGVTGEAEVVAVLDGLAPGSAFAYDTRAHMRQALGDQAAAMRDYDRALFYGASQMAKLYQCGLSDLGIYTGPLDGVGGLVLFQALEKCAAMQDCDPLPPNDKCR